MWYSWKYGHLSSGITTRCPANQSDAKLLEGGVDSNNNNDNDNYNNNNNNNIDYENDNDYDNDN